MLFKHSLCRISHSNKISPILRHYCSTIPEKTVVISQQTINYISVGNGEKTVFCFPGALGTIWSDFLPQINGLDKSKFRIVVWDPPGYGKSRPPNRKFTNDLYQNDANLAYSFLQKIGIEKASVLGWSDGGIGSMILAANYPKIVEKLVVWGANSYVLPEEIKLYEKVRDVSNWSDRMKAPLVEMYTEEGLQILWSGWCDTLKEICENGGDICKTLLPKIKCPTLILHGDLDPMVAPEHPDYLHNHIKNSVLHRFPNGKHNIHLRYSQDFNQIVTDFLTKREN